LSRKQATADLASADSRKRVGALLSLALYDSDWRWVQDQCLRLLADSDEEVVATAILGLGHLARLHQRLDLDRVLPALKTLQAEPRFGGRVSDAFDDIRMFVPDAKGRVEKVGMEPQDTGDELPRSIEEARDRTGRPRPAPPSDGPGFYVDVRDKPAFLLAALRLLAGGAHISFEGDLGGCDFASIAEVSLEETRALLRNTAFPRQDFLILPLEPDTIDAVMQGVPPAQLVKKIHHVQIEKGRRLELGIYDQFDPDSSWVGEAFSAPFLDSLRAKTILRNWEAAPYRGESMSDEFVNYVGHPDLHDGTIERVERSSDLASVTVVGGSGTRRHLESWGASPRRANLGRVIGW
jgi:hypothetical protein